MREMIKAIYFWTHMRDNIECYVHTFLVFQQEKVEQRHPGGLKDPLPISECPWESVTMEFITSLPMSDRFGTIMIVVDRFSMGTTSIPTTAGCTAKEAARLFFKNMLKYWGMPRHIISDRDLRFIGNCLRELFERVGTKLHFSTSFHLQTDGHTECVKDLLECY